MSGPIDGRTLTVVNAIRASMQINAGPGSSINTHPNMFFLNVIGEVDLLKAAEQVIKSLTQYDAAQKPKETDAATRASAVDGH